MQIANPADQKISKTTLIADPADPAVLDQAAALLDAQAVIAAPTDTVYGLVCRYDSVAAIDALYEAKGRPPQKALPVLLAGEDQLDQVVAHVSALARGLMAEFWPGPLTLALPGLPHLPARLTAGMDSVAVRVPDHPVLRALARRTGPLASSSANRSGGPDTASAAGVLAQLDGFVPLILDGGTAPGGIPSTVLALAENGKSGPVILREGPIGDQVRAFLGGQSAP